jgi:quercetin dioxygenase-like cupin family protein
MRQHTLIGQIGIAAVVMFVIGLTMRSDAQVGPSRKILLQRDLDIPGYETILNEASVAVGGREGKHRHPGAFVAYLLEGEMTLEMEGQPSRTLKAGDSVFVPAGQVHEGINTGRVPIKALVTFIVKKGQPLTTPAP